MEENAATEPKQAKMTWADLVSKAGEIAAILEAQGGEDPDGIFDKFLDDQNQKIEAYYVIIERFKANADLLKKEERRIKDRRQSLEAWIEKRKWCALQILKSDQDLYGTDRINTGRITALISSSKSAVIDDQTKLAPEWLREELKTSPDKAAILSALKAGETIDGARLETRESVRFTNGAT